MAEKGKPTRQRRAATREFTPNRPITLVSRGEAVVIPGQEASPQRVGWKAHGLGCVPAKWVPPFFVVDGSFPTEHGSVARRSEGRLNACMAELDLVDAAVIVRSSGTMETIEHRGQLPSQTCAANDVPETIRRLCRRVSATKTESVHWIVQKFVRPARRGHLSNERRVSKEPRDFVAELEPQGDRPGYTLPVAVRHWRVGSEPSESELSCSSEAAMTLRFRPVAVWASRLPTRVLFEWVWSGSRMWIVQADPAKPLRGVNPKKLLPRDFPAVSTASLRAFQVAGEAEFEKYRKLQNAKVYRDIGYSMPTFYVLDDAAVMRGVLQGNIHDGLESDIMELTRRPLMIRTDGPDIPRGKREMLPRSEDLRTPAQAKNWLAREFPREIERLEIADRSLSLIAHHFIPSASAAWARSEPGSETVRIESLWGLPEGLYWHSHDTFEVDTGGRLPIRRRQRFKGTFVAPNEEGHWVHYHPAPPFDWGSSIPKREWLEEIATRTKQIAEHEGEGVKVMWFVGNDSRATRHKVLPWYHAESEIGTPKAAPRRKLTASYDFTVESTADWEALKSLVRKGKRIERVMLEPKEPELVRNQGFAKELAAFATKHGIVIELAGGVLSHAYHILQREGAQVECIDLFGAEEESVEYDKLVRDKIPDQIEQKGEGVEVVILKEEALLAALLQKLVEESYEALDARTGSDIVGELADIEEVVEGILRALQESPDVLKKERKAKRKRSGGFGCGLMLRKTTTPHTLAKRPAGEDKASLATPGSPQLPSIEQAGLIPSPRRYGRPDVRNVEHGQEGLFTFDTQLSRLGTDKRSAVLNILINRGEAQGVRVSVELKRYRSSLWGQVKLRPEPSQMSMRLVSEAQGEFDFTKSGS